MPLFAMSFHDPIKTASLIFARGYGFKMVWIYARVIAALVIQLQPGGDFSLMQDIGKSMCRDLLVAVAQIPIARAVRRAKPQPAARHRFGDVLVLETLDRSLSEHSNPHRSHETDYNMLGSAIHPNTPITNMGAAVRRWVWTDCFVWNRMIKSVDNYFISIWRQSVSFCARAI